METLCPHLRPGVQPAQGYPLPSLYFGPPAPRPLQAAPPTIGDEGPVAGWMQQEVFLSRDHTVEVLIVVLMHC